MQPHSYFFLSDYFQKKFGGKTRKLTLPGGTTCPNRDGTIGVDGCAFCGANGGGDQTLSKIEDIQHYLEQSKAFLQKKYGAQLFFVYFQNFTSLYKPHPAICKILPFIAQQSDIVGVALSARPDFLDETFLLEIQQQLPQKEIWVDIGLQSADNRSLQKMNRGHSAEDFAEAIHKIDRLNIKSCAHIIAGLPGETLDDWIATIHFLNDLPISGLKIHPLHIVRNSLWENAYAQQKITLQSRNTFVQWAVQALAHLRPDIVIHRLTGEIDREHLIAPNYCREKLKLLNDIHRTLAEANIFQGKYYEK